LLPSDTRLALGRRAGGALSAARNAPWRRPVPAASPNARLKATNTFMRRAPARGGIGRPLLGGGGEPCPAARAAARALLYGQQGHSVELDQH
jgi:hypothetical protein